MADEIPPFKVFYSWQSDLEPKSHRYAISDALREARKKAPRPVEIVDATRDEPGAPEVAGCLFKRIEESDAFVGDASLINATNPRPRLTSNPNVLTEVGYAARALGWDRVVIVCNIAWGPVEELPFDIRSRRPLTYDSRREGFKAELRAQAVAAISMLVERGKHRRGLSWMNDDERAYRLAAAHVDLDAFPRFLEEHRAALARRGTCSISLSVRSLERCLEIAWLELARADAACLQAFVRHVETFNSIRSAIPAGASIELVMPSMEAMRVEMERLETLIPRIDAILEHAASARRPVHGALLDPAPGPMPYSEQV